MRKIFPILLTSAVFLTAGVALAQSVSTPTASSTAGSPSEVTYPITDLGNCASRDECKAYCDSPAHVDACFTFAQAHGLMKSNDIQKAKDFLKLKGPAGCSGLACKIYCSDPSHQDECFAFAKTNHLISDSNAKIIDDMKAGGGPGGCASTIECRTFCAESANHDACMQFAQAHNIPLPDQIALKDARSVSTKGSDTITALLASKPGPGGCAALQTCKAYCDDTTHITECVQFAQDNGLMTATEAIQANKLASPGPGGCLGIACKTYCSDSSHLDECDTFAVENGFTLKNDSRGASVPSTQMAPPTGAQGTSTKPANLQSINTGNAGAPLPDSAPQPPAQVPTTQEQAQIKAMCTQYGGTWDGQHCIKTTTDGTAPQQPLDATEMEIEQKCQSLGGMWDGQRCTKPVAPPVSTTPAQPTKFPFPIPQHSEPSSMTPLSAFTASVFAIFLQLVH